jgi:hypothetical protein
LQQNKPAGPPGRVGLTQMNDVLHQKSSSGLPRRGFLMQMIGSGCLGRANQSPVEGAGRVLAALQAAGSCTSRTQGIGLRPKPWAWVSRPVGPVPYARLEVGFIRRCPCSPGTSFPGGAACGDFRLAPSPTALPKTTKLASTPFSGRTLHRGVILPNLTNESR